MQARKLLELLAVAERLKHTTRHCTTSKGRPESVAEHCWRAALMALFMREEFPGVDMDRVIKMCLVHDLGECFTGDIPVFAKTKADEQTEADLLADWLGGLSPALRQELESLFAEMEARSTPEARLFKAIDGLEAVIQHNESPISTWEPHEYQLNLTYGWDRVGFSPFLTRLRQEMEADTRRKIQESGEQPPVIV